MKFGKGEKRGGGMTGHRTSRKDKLLRSEEWKEKHIQRERCLSVSKKEEVNGCQKKKAEMGVLQREGVI